MKVWVVYYEYEHDGCSEPLHVFATEAAAKVWAGVQNTARYEEMEIEGEPS